MEYECLISHNQPGHEPGKFKSYEAGKTYDLEHAEYPYWRAVYGSTEGQKPAARAAKKTKAAEG